MKNGSKSTIAFWAILFIGLAVSSGCVDRLYPKTKVGYPASPPRNDVAPKAVAKSETDLLAAAQRDHSQARHEQALIKYKEFLDRYPDSSYADSALVSIGQIHEIMGRKNDAIIAYQDLWDNYPRSKFQSEAGRRLAALYLDQGKHDRSINIISILLSQSQREVETARLQIMMGRGYLGQGNLSGALEMFVKAYHGTTDPADKDDSRRGMMMTIKKMAPEELRQARILYDKDYPGGYVSYLLAYRLFELGRKDEARDVILGFTQQFPNHELTANARDLLQAIDGQAPLPGLPEYRDFGPSPVGPVTGPEIAAGPVGPLPDYQTMNVACLLPLSGGAASEYGLKVKKGLELAFKLYHPQTQGFKSDLVVLDSRGDPQVAADLAAQAAANANILAMVGPLMSKVAVEVGPRAEQLALPTIMVTQKNGIPEMGSHIFRLFLTPQVQAQAVARYTVQVLGLRRLAILHPNDNYGQTMSNYFRTEAEGLGASIVTVESYGNDTTDFAPYIQKLAGVGKAQKKVGVGRKVSVDFEAVYLPDSYQAVAMIAPQFAYHDITSIRLLGSSLWHTPKLLETVARYTQGSVIPTSFFANSNRPEVVDFVKAYRQETGEETAEPDRFEAYGYDAGILLLTLMDKYHITSREAIVKTLTNMAPFNGVTGRFYFDSQGEYRSEPQLITVDGSEFKLIQ